MVSENSSKTLHEDPAAARLSAQSLLHSTTVPLGIYYTTKVDTVYTLQPSKVLLNVLLCFRPTCLFYHFPHEQGPGASVHMPGFIWGRSVDLNS